MHGRAERKQVSGKSPRSPSGHACAHRIRRGHATTDQYYKREPGFFAISLQEHFQFCRDWYRRDEVRHLVLEYYFVFRSVLRAKPGLRRCVSRCRHCRIFFLTHPRNAGRRDLACPFGCREAERKWRSTQRSVEYYGTEEGKVKKQIQNGKRRRNPAGAEEEPGAAKSSPAPGSHHGAPPQRAPLLTPTLGRPEFEAGMVAYVRMVVSLIEGRRVSRDEIVNMLARALRQHSMARRRRIDYVVGYVRGNPP